MPALPNLLDQIPVPGVIDVPHPSDWSNLPLPEAVKKGFAETVVISNPVKVPEPPPPTKEQQRELDEQLAIERAAELDGALFMPDTPRDIAEPN